MKHGSNYTYTHIEKTSAQFSAGNDEVEKYDTIH